VLVGWFVSDGLEECEDIFAERLGIEVFTEDGSVDNYGRGEFGEELQVRVNSIKTHQHHQPVDLRVAHPWSAMRTMLRR
jgi:hypothetical protein